MRTKKSPKNLKKCRWLAILSKNRARIYEETKSGVVLKPVKTLVNPIGREQANAIQRHKPSIVKSSGGISHTLRGKKDPQDDSAKQFALTISGFLDAERKKNRFQEIIVYAEPRFLGRFRKSLPTPTFAKITAWVKKDLDNLDENNLSDFLGHRRIAKSEK